MPRISSRLMLRLTGPIAAATWMALGSATPVQAQDWETTTAANGIKVVSIEYDNGIGIAFRCEDQSLDALLVGLPPTPLPGPAFELQARNIRLFWGRDEPIDVGRWWRTTQPEISLTDSPAGLARALRRGGELHIVAADAGEGGTDLRYIVELPPSYAALEEILSVCGQPLVDPVEMERMDQIEPWAPGQAVPALVWRHRPRLEFPSTHWNSGVARLNCLVEPSGSLSSCFLEGELPRGAGFGRSALRAARRASVRRADGSDAPIPTSQISFAVRYHLAP